jgi:two-component sensor histidine kinase
MTAWEIFSGPQRIRTYLVLYALALTLPLLALSAFALDRMARIEQAQMERRVMQVAQELAGDVDRDLDRAFATLETLATSPELRRGDFRAFHAQAALALKRTKAAIVLVDRSYQQLMDTLVDYGTDLPRTADPATAQRVFDTRQRQVSNLFRGSISGRPVFNVEVPVFEADGAVRYVLIMSFQAAHIVDILATERLEAPWITGVTDNNGIILARSERHDEFVGKPLPPELLTQSRAAATVFRAVNVAGVEILRATVRSDLAGWLVSATVPVSHVEEPRRRSYLFAGILLGVTLVLGVALAYMFGRFMTRPLDEATQVAASVGRGEAVDIHPSALVEANVLMTTLSEASSELQRRQEHLTFLMRELAHRAKNQLAVVKGMAQQTARRSGSLSDFMERFNRRVQGLAQSQDVMVRENWKGASMKDLVRAQLELFAADERAEISGPDLFLDTTAVQNLSFAFHELATNASKHGVLSSPQGRIMVTWSGPETGSVRIDWTEQGGQPVAAPQRAGFGHRVITELVPRALQGRSELDYTADGLRWQLEFPAHHVLSNRGAA